MFLGTVEVPAGYLARLLYRLVYLSLSFETKNIYQEKRATLFAKFKIYFFALQVVLTLESD